MQQKIEIRVKGQIDKAWSEWFNELTIEHCEHQNETVLTGFVADQAALYGLLAKLRDIGLELVSFESERVAEDEGDEK
jgi:hypothetical protein